MITRTTSETVTFANPFRLGDFDEVLPAGAYEVETDEQLIEGLSFPAYRRVMVVIQIPAGSGGPDHARSLTVDPKVLDAALWRDRTPAGRPATRPRAKAPTAGEADRAALDRAEDEGMQVHPA